VDVISFVQNVANDLPQPNSNYAAIKFGSDVEEISDVTSDITAFKESLTTAKYKGGYTNTEQAILRCTELLEDQPNPVILLVTDGTPTTCRRGWQCKGAAENAADRAFGQDVEIVPIIINSVSTDIKQIAKFARCRNPPCPSVDITDIGGLNEIIGEVIEAATCRDET